MKLILYTKPGCPNCNVIKIKLKQKNIGYELVEDLDKAIKIGQAHNINSTPILQVDDNFYDYLKAIEWIKGR